MIVVTTKIVKTVLKTVTMVSKIFAINTQVKDHIPLKKQKTEKN